MPELPNARTGPARRRSLSMRAVDDLRFIRASMERAGERAAAFTALPGWGGVLMGCVALIAAATAMRATDQVTWLLTWLGAAVVAGLIGASDMARKASESRTSLLRGPASRFATNLIAPFIAAALLTWIMYRHGQTDLMPALWLLLYGTAVISAGAFSIRAVRYMGAGFMLLGVAAALSPTWWGNGYMAAGFGGLHMVFGLWIARHHDV